MIDFLNRFIDSFHGQGKKPALIVLPLAWFNALKLELIGLNPDHADRLAPFKYGVAFRGVDIQCGLRALHVEFL